RHVIPPDLGPIPMDRVVQTLAHHALLGVHAARLILTFGTSTPGIISNQFWACSSFSLRAASSAALALASASFLACSSLATSAAFCSGVMASDFCFSFSFGYLWTAPSASTLN